MRHLVSSDIPDIALGSSLLGAGGGGDPYVGGLIARQALDKAGSVELYDADEVPDEWLVATIGGVGAPSVLAEKGINGCEITNLLAAQEEQLGRKLDAIVLSEIGGMNSVIPVAAAAIAGIPLVNVDGMGRAFPGLQQDSYNIAGVHTWPMAFADEKGNVAMLTTVDNDWMENLGRATVDAMGGQGIALGQFMSGETMKRAAAIMRELHCPFVINQNRYSIFDRTIEQNGLKKTANQMGKGIIAFSPLAQGLLTDKYLHGIPSDSRIAVDGRFLHADALTKEKLAQIEALNKMAGERGQSLAQMALSWILKDEDVTSVLIGASRPEQIIQNVEIVQNTKFTREELKKIDQISRGDL